MRALTEVPVLPGPQGAHRLQAALATALAGGPAVAPVPYPADGRADAATERVRTALRPDDPGAPLDRQDVVAVVATSGSTGDPRGVLLTGGAVRAATAALHDLLGGPGDWVAALPVHSVGGLMVLVRALLGGGALAVDDSIGGASTFTAAGFAAAVAQGRGTGAGSGRLYASLVPTQLRRLVDAGPVGLLALQECDAILSGAAATPPDLLEVLRGNGIRVLASYGMSETCGGCAYDGVPLPGLVFRTDAADGRALGRISVSGPSVAGGYRLCPGDPGLSGDVVRTNDVGTVGADGRVDLVGRADDVVVVGGTNVALPAVEAALRTVPGVGDACVVAVPDPVWGARIRAFLTPPAATPGGHDVRPADKELATAVRLALGRAGVPRELTWLAQIPLLTTGKADRRSLAQRPDPDCSH